MSNWVIIDCIGQHNTGEFPEFVIRSEVQLRAELNRFRARRPSIILVVSPEEETLKIGIGGPFSGIRWAKPPIDDNYKLAIASEIVAPEGAEFREQGSDTGFRAKYVLPVEQAIEIIVFFYKHHRLPQWIQWLSWNPDTRSLEVLPADSSADWEKV
jgi:hypothetical protein